MYDQPVTLLAAFELLTDGKLLAEEMENLAQLLETPRREVVHAHFANRFLTQPEEQLGGVREAGATIIAAAQSTTPLVPPLGNDKAKVLTLNLRNRLIFRAADEADAVQAADFLGKKLLIKRSWGYSAGKRNVNYSEIDEHKIKPHKLRTLRDHECVLVHCEGGFGRVTLPPLEPNAGIPEWYRRWR
jgi:hypothetical protein